MEGLALRPARRTDADVLLRWANDPTTRRASFSPATIDRGVHERWLESLLHDPERRLFVAELEGEPVGQVRLDAADDQFEISVSISPQHRGRGLGRAVIRLACLAAGGRVVARIRSGNLRSVEAFQAAGFRRIDADDHAMIYHWEPTDEISQ